MHSRELGAACRRGDAAAALRALAQAPGCTCCTSAGSGATCSQAQASSALLLQVDAHTGRTLLHHLCTGESLGLAGALLCSLTGAGAGGVRPARHQQARASLLAVLLARQPRLALLAACPDAAGQTPVHCAVLSQSMPVLALLLASLHQLLPAAPGSPVLHLLLSVPDREGRTALELALQLRQWPAARLLAAAVGAGGLPLGRSYLGPATLVHHYLCLGGGGGGGALAPPAAAEGTAALGPISVSGSGSTVTEALGGLLSRVWDALGSTAAAAAAADGTPAPALAGAAAGSGSSSGPAAVQQQQGRLSAAPLQPQAVTQEQVLELVRQEEEQALSAARTAASSAARPAKDAAAAEGNSGGGAPAAALLACTVCFEELPPGWLGTRLRCRHPTCDACWRGILLAAIDEGNARRAVCPQPGCRARLPLSAAARLLPAHALRRWQRLKVQAHVTAHPEALRCCPQPACGAMLLLPPDAAAVASAASATGAGLDAECAACGHLLCWCCQEDAGHEPATCSQMQRWGEELGALRQAAPDADRQWLSSNTKRCPACKAHVQRNGGCLHITCRCGAHFCWVCGRPWSDHSPESGGFYYCTLDARTDLPEYSAGLGGDGGGAGLGGAFGWLAGVWTSIRSAALQHQLQRQLRTYLRLSGSRAPLYAAAAHMQLLLSAAGLLAGGCGGGEQGSAAAAAAAASVGPELLGIGAAEARRLSSQEWRDLLAAAAASAADAAHTALPAQLDVPAAQAAAQAALEAAAGGGSGLAGAGYLQDAAEAVASALNLLQHSAVALFLLPSGAPRRHLLQLSTSMQSRVEQLQPLLLALPEREALPPAPARQQQRQATRPSSAQPTGSAHSGGGGGGGGLGSWLLQRLYGIDRKPSLPPTAPERQRALALPGDILLQQAAFAAAVHQRQQQIEAAVRALNADAREMRRAARAGLYA